MTQVVSVSLKSEVVYVTGTVNSVLVTWTRYGDEWRATVERSQDNNYHVELTAVDTAGNSANYALDLYYGLKLITDRVSADVKTVKNLSKIKYSDMTDEQKQQWDQVLKGSYDYRDLNRVGNALIYLKDLLIANGYMTEFNPKNTWVESDKPTPLQLADYLAQVQYVRNLFSSITDFPELPNTINNLTTEQANNIERVLELVDFFLQQSNLAHFMSNEIFAGEV